MLPPPCVRMPLPIRKNDLARIGRPDDNPAPLLLAIWSRTALPRKAIKIETIVQVRWFPTPITTVAPIFSWRRRKSEPVMSSKRVRQNAAKAIVWLTVAMFALPATPASACHCATGAVVSSCGCCGQQGLSQSGHYSAKGHRACCSQNGNTTNSCCKKGSLTAPAEGCSCGNSCSCKSGQHPAQPADPLTPQEDSPSKVGGAESQASLSTPVALPSVRPLVVYHPERINCGSSLERCISLSRFTL